jgi:lysophospholipase L1-like esterase
MRSNKQTFLQAVILGDSICWSSEMPFGQRYGDHIERLLQAKLGSDVTVDVAICGDGSDTVAQGLARVERDCLAYEPHLVLVNLGANNMLQARERIEPDLRCLIERLLAHRPTPVVILETIPILHDQRHGFRTVTEVIKAGGSNRALEKWVHAIVRRLASAYRLQLHDRFRRFHRALESRPQLIDSLIRPDGAHFTSAGNRFFARDAASLLAQHAPRPPVISKRPALDWLAQAEANAAFRHCTEVCAAERDLFLRTSGSWSRLMLQQCRSFARRAACMSSRSDERERALRVAALAAGYSALQRAMACPWFTPREKRSHLTWFMGQVRPFRHDPRIKEVIARARELAAG